MEKLKNKAAKKYLHRIKSHLPCSYRERKKMIAPLCQSINDYLAEQPNAGMEALQARFGTPESVAAMCLEATDMTSLLHRLSIKRRIVRIVTVSLLIALLLWSTFIFFTYQSLKNQIYDGKTIQFFVEET